MNISICVFFVMFIIIIMNIFDWRMIKVKDIDILLCGY